MPKRPKWARVGTLVSVSPEVVDEEREAYLRTYTRAESEHIAGYIWIIADRRKTPRDSLGFNKDHDWYPELVLCKSLATGGYHYWWGNEIEPMKEE